jgi:phosphoribosylanthranilate isomerase
VASLPANLRLLFADARGYFVPAQERSGVEAAAICGSMNAGPINVKICGITGPQDARLAAEAGADAIGLNFVAGPRRIDLDTAGPIVAAVPEGVEIWVLFDLSQRELPEPLRHLAQRSRISRVQMYGQVVPETIARVHDLGIDTVAVRYAREPELSGTSEWLKQFSQHPPCLLLIDSSRGKQLGGTGQVGDWDLIAKLRRSGRTEGWPPTVLAGGLNPDNVAEAIQTVAPAWVDVCSGVESSPGRKDAGRTRAFVQAAKRLRQD